jgi:mono/diheme cytochrome c family protein
MSKYIIALILAGSSAGFIGAAQQPGSKIEKVPIQQTSMTSGEQMFTTYCATCHGAAGIGNGPAAKALKVPPANLTTLSQRNGGVFPADHVISVLKFGMSNPAHGSPEMPVWSDLLRTLNQQSRDDGEVRLRISNLTSYLKQIQK